jgi:hypothetical protein
VTVDATAGEVVAVVVAEIVVVVVIVTAAEHGQIQFSYARSGI